MVDLETFGRQCNKPYITLSNYETMQSDGKNRTQHRVFTSPLTFTRRRLLGLRQGCSCVVFPLQRDSIWDKRRNQPELPGSLLQQRHVRPKNSPGAFQIPPREEDLIPPPLRPLTPSPPSPPGHPRRASKHRTYRRQRTQGRPHTQRVLYSNDVYLRHRSMVGNWACSYVYRESVHRNQRRQLNQALLQGNWEPHYLHPFISRIIFPHR